MHGHGIPPLVHYIHGPFVITTVPPLYMTRRDVDINRAGNDHGRGTNHDRGGIDNHRLRIRAKIDMTVKARLDDTDRHADTGGLRCRDRKQGYRKD
jgi:hypothetical protein